MIYHFLKSLSPYMKPLLTEKYSLKFTLLVLAIDAIIITAVFLLQ